MNFLLEDDMPFRHVAVRIIATLALFAVPATMRAQTNEIPREFVGDWVPATSACSAPLRFRVAPKQVMLVNGRDSATFGDVDICMSCVGGARYEGITVMMKPQYSTDDAPFMAYFNDEEKRGVTKLQDMKPDIARRFPVSNVALRKCPSLTSSTAAVPALPRTSVCEAGARCSEVQSFATTIADVRTSQQAGTRYVAVTLRFQNKLTRAIILGYVAGSGLVIDDQGNRYQLQGGDRGASGIGQISPNSYDPKFVLQPGESGNARFEFAWGSQTQIAGTFYEMGLAVREIVPVPGNQLRLGPEYALRFDNLRPAPNVAAAPSDAPPIAAAPSPGGSAAGEVPAPISTGDACAGSAMCSDAGPFVAHIMRVTPSKTGGWALAKFDLRITNRTNRPLILAYKFGTSLSIDDNGNRWNRGAGQVDKVKGIGIVTGSSADPQFVVAPGKSRDASFETVLGIYANTNIGTVHSYDVTLVQLEILPSRQIREVREYALTYTGLTAGRTSTGAAASDPVTSAGSALVDSVAQRGIRGILKRLPKPKP